MTPTPRLPDFLIIGAQKCGTTSLFRLLEAHPSFAMSTPKEVHFFSEHFRRGTDWYREHFPPARSDQQVGEATPLYLFWPACLERISALLPNARLVVLLREPGARAYSHYHHEVALGREQRGFEQALDEEEPLLEQEMAAMTRNPEYFSQPARCFSYLARGRYAQQLERVYRFFDHRQVHVTACDRLFAGEQEALDDLFRFLGAREAGDARLGVHYARDYDPMPLSVRGWLDDYFAEPNRALSLMLEHPPSWCAALPSAVSAVKEERRHAR
ncbi:MAG: sulfotransferase domain-containing protein [Acidobacteriota bacterium]